MMYGSASQNSPGTCAISWPRSPVGGEIVSEVLSPVADANSSAAPKAPRGVHRPTIIAARPMNPRPADMSALKLLVCSMLNQAPPSAASAPDMTTFR